MARGARSILPRLAALAAALLLTLALVGSAGAQAVERSVLSARDDVEGEAIAEINELRRGKGLRVLAFSARLARAAEAHVLSMAREGYFSHSSSDGTVFWKRIRRYYPAAGFRSWTVGENLLWASPDVTPEDALEMWLASPTHRRVLLSKRWREVGIAAVHVTNAPGLFGGRDVTILTADFGARR